MERMAKRRKTDSLYEKNEKNGYAEMATEGYEKFSCNLWDTCSFKLTYYVAE